MQGIYAIVNMENGHLYIGSSKNILKGKETIAKRVEIFKRNRELGIHKASRKARIEKQKAEFLRTYKKNKKNKPNEIKPLFDDYD